MADNQISDTKSSVKKAEARKHYEMFQEKEKIKSRWVIMIIGTIIILTLRYVSSSVKVSLIHIALFNIFLISNNLFKLL